MLRFSSTLSDNLNIVRCTLYMICVLCAISCSKNEEEAGEYDSWQVRNQAYVDSIASLAKQGTDGWTRTLVYYYQQEYADNNPDENNIYVYMKTLQAGTGTVKPLFSDSVRVHYRGRFIPSKSYHDGYVFGQSFTESDILSINDATAVPTLLPVSGENVAGFCQALQEMVEGDVVRIVIPYLVGYGAPSSRSTIPDYSALTFDVKLAKLYKRGENLTWR